MILYISTLTFGEILQQYRNNGWVKKTSLQYKPEGPGSASESSHPDWTGLQTVHDPHAAKPSETR